MADLVVVEGFDLRLTMHQPDADTTGLEGPI